jgi:sugar/nucleoside kinase (ribokinase family)
MSFAVVGSIAFDSIRTPFGEAERELGGSATHAAFAGSFFTDVAIVGPVGEDFETEHYERFERNDISTHEMVKIRGGRTFEWRGHYDYDLNVAHTDATDLNVFDGWQPRLSNGSREADTLFLAAMDPETQIDVRSQWQGDGWSAIDSVSYWIETKREALIEAIGVVDFVLLNDQEARALTGKPMLLEAAREIMTLGPIAVVLKLGEYGCALLHEEGYFALPGYPLEETRDPTGTGDALAGGFLGYLDRGVPGSRLTADVLRRALTYGSVMASYCAEDFGTRRLSGMSEHEVLHRADDFKEMTHFEHVPTAPRPTALEDQGPRFERPADTPSTRRFGAMWATAGTQRHRSPQRTPSTETMPRPREPLPRVHPAEIAVPPPAPRG